MFAKRLNETRKAKGFTALYMAETLQMKIRGYRKYESGDTSPSIETLSKIADVLSVSTDYLLCRTGVCADISPTNPPACPTDQ